MGSGQQRALAELGPRFVLPFEPRPAGHGETLSAARRHAHLEIGFGMGDATAPSRAAPARLDFIGIEVHPPGVGALLQRIGERGTDNLRIVQHDAVEVLRR
jgi:tRNA (guanine-N7-)-methyltransferase